MINGYAFVNNKLLIDLYRFSAITLCIVYAEPKTKEDEVRAKTSQTL